MNILNVCFAYYGNSLLVQDIRVGGSGHPCILIKCVVSLKYKSCFCAIG